jgi:hypothetical protein
MAGVLLQEASQRDTPTIDDTAVRLKANSQRKGIDHRGMIL